MSIQGERIRYWASHFTFEKQLTRHMHDHLELVSPHFSASPLQPFPPNSFHPLSTYLAVVQRRSLFCTKTVRLSTSIAIYCFSAGSNSSSFSLFGSCIQYSNALARCSPKRSFILIVEAPMTLAWLKMAVSASFAGAAPSGGIAR